MKNVVMMIRIAAVMLGAVLAARSATAQMLKPASGARSINPDVQLTLTFRDAPRIGMSGKIRIYDAATDRLVDELDMSVPAGPTRSGVPGGAYLSTPYPYARDRRATNRDTKPGMPSAGAVPTPADYQLTIIGGFTDGFHFYPVTVYGNTATIHPHHDLLEYGRAYYVQVDPGVLVVPNDPFGGVAGKSWRFATTPAAKAPPPGATVVTVAADGSGDFDTVQAALDWVPDHSRKHVTIRVADGLYEEIVYARNKDNVTLLGESEAHTILRYANNEVFNPHPANIRTNEKIGTYPSRRAAVAIDHCNDFHIVNMTMWTTAPGQAEGLLIAGERDILSHVTVIGAGDAFQANGTIYVADSTILGQGDTILGRGAVFFDRSVLRSTKVMMYIRNFAPAHGNVFHRSTIAGIADPITIARSSSQDPVGYPDAEVVLIDTTLDRIAPEGWGDASKAGGTRYWEYGSRNADGSSVDTSKRVPWSRQLDRVRDAKLIANYSTPAFVLGGWTPTLTPSETRW